MADPAQPGSQPTTVAGISELYLGNILYALERCALAMAEEGRSADATFYRGIGRMLAEAHGKSKQPPAAG